MSTAPALQTEAIRLYCGCGEMKWNGLPVEVGPYACVSPVYGRSQATKSVNRVRLSPDTVAVLQDSGAFSDASGQRLSFEAARRRQIEHAERFGYASRVTHRASYDQMVADRSTWSRADAWSACIATIQAARYLHTHRDNLHCVFSAQGLDAAQYLACVQGVLPYVRDGDMIGLGGFCLIGRLPRKTMPLFRETMHTIIPFLGHEGIQQVHIWGCLYAPALGELLWLCDRHHITLSTDSPYPSLRPVLGKWGYSRWADATYKNRRPSTGPDLGRDRQRHCWLTRQWLSDFREREPAYYRWHPLRTQHALPGVSEDQEAFPVLREMHVGKEENEQDVHEYFCAPRRNRMGCLYSA